jgi:UDP-N-acetyl-D-glucosamine dehydrogenase
VTYKPNIADVRGSPATPLAKCLMASGANVSFHDPHVKNWTVAGHDLTSESDLYGAVADADVTVLLQDHSDYEIDVLAICSRRFLDTCGIAQDSATVERL